MSDVPKGLRTDIGALSTEDLRARLKAELADKPGTCCCPVFEDGRRGFRQKCEVHGRRSREDYARITAMRGELFGRLTAPASVKGIK